MTWYIAGKVSLAAGYIIAALIGAALGWRSVQ